MIYIYTDMEQFSENDYIKCQKLLSADRLRENEHFAFYENRKQSMLAYLLLRYALLVEYGIYSQPQLRKDGNGKPYLKSMEWIHINLSHCCKGIMCGVSKHEIGVDIQEHVPYDETDFRSVLTPSEIKAINSDAEFAKIWTLKECYGKYTGEGITYSLDSMDFSDIGTEWCKRHGHLFSSECTSETADSVCADEVMERITVSHGMLLKAMARILSKE